MTLEEFDTIYDADWGEAYMEFARHDGPWVEAELTMYNEERLASKEEQAIAQFVLTGTGCWDRGWSDAHVAERVLTALDGDIHSIQENDVRADVWDAMHDALQQVDDMYKITEWLSGHRFIYLNALGDLSDIVDEMVQALVDLSEHVHPHSVSSYIDQIIEEYDRPYYEAFHDFGDGDIRTFSPQTVFDWLERIGRGGDFDEDFYPRPHIDYLVSRKIFPGFALLFCGDIGKPPEEVMAMRPSDVRDCLGVDSLQPHTEFLCDELQREFNWDDRHVMWDAETTICNFKEHTNYDMDKWWPDRPDEDQMQFDEF